MNEVGDYLFDQLLVAGVHAVGASAFEAAAVLLPCFGCRVLVLHLPCLAVVVQFVTHHLGTAGKECLLELLKILFCHNLNCYAHVCERLKNYGSAAGASFLKWYHKKKAPSLGFSK